MEDERYERLSEGQKDCLRLFQAHYQIKEIASELGVHVSSVNERLRRARTILGVNSSNEAARMFAAYEQRQGTWIPPTGSANTIASIEPSTADAATHRVDGHLDELMTDNVLTYPLFGETRHEAGGRFGWPFPTSGRRDNDLSGIIRMAWVVPCAVVALVAMLLVAVLTIGLQDVLTKLPHALMRLF